MNKLHLVAVLNGTDYPYEVSVREHEDKMTHYRHAAENAVRQAGIFNDRKHPTASVGVEIFALAIKELKIVRHRITKTFVIPPVKPLTEAEFKAELTKLLDEIPEEFHRFFLENAREHCSGHEETISYLSELIDSLSPCIDKYTQNLRLGHQP